MTEAGERSAAPGGRRRRREAERAAALAAEQAGAPLSRREIRRREAEEAARLEAIATGELPLGMRGADEPVTVASGVAVSAGSAATTAGSAASATSAATAETAPTSEAAAGPGPRSAGGTPSRRSIRERLDTGAAAPTTPQERTGTGRRPIVRTPTSATGVRRLDATGQLTGIQPAVRPDAPAQHPLTGGIATGGGGSAGADGRADGSRPRDDAAGRPAEVVPASVTGVGRDTGESTGTSDPTAWAGPPATTGDETAVSSPTAASADTPATSGAAWARWTDEAGAGERGAAGSADEAVGSTVEGAVRPADENADDDNDWDEPPMRPQWVAISSVSGASADEAPRKGPTRRSLREAASAPSASSAGTAEPPGAAAGQADDADRERPNPALTVMKVIVLALVAAIIGALIWILATEAFDDSAAAAAHGTMSSIIDHHEETSGS